MSDILILGGTGAMGAPLSKLLAEQGYNVYVTSRSAHKDDGRLHYVRGNAKDISFISQYLDNHYFDAIVDFMVYSTSDFLSRYEFYLSRTQQYVFVSSARVFAESKSRLTEDSPRLLDVVNDKDYLATDEYALAKARQEDILKSSGAANWTIVRPSITYNTYRLQLGEFEKENWLYRALKGRAIVVADDISDKFTSMTSGDDVALSIARLLGKRECLCESFNIASGISLRWKEILDIYIRVLYEEKGITAKVMSCKETIKSNDPSMKYQIIYARRLNRSFDDSKIIEACGISFTGPADGLSEALRNFLAKPRWKGINWKYEAWMDRITGEHTPINEIPGLKSKFMYICYRNHLGGFHAYAIGCWRKVKRLVTNNYSK